MNPEQQQQVPPTEYYPHENPGKTMGIVGFVLAFVVSIAGLIVSIIALRKSRAAKYGNPLAIAGIIISSLSILFWILVIPAITIVSYQGITNRANTTTAQMAASNVVKKSAAYWAETKTYPRSANDLNKPGEIYHVQGVVFASEPLTEKPLDAHTVTFYTCGNEGNKVEYWDYTENEPVALYIGDASTTTSCSLAH